MQNSTWSVTFLGIARKLEHMGHTCLGANFCNMVSWIRFYFNTKKASLGEAFLSIDTLFLEVFGVFPDSDKHHEDFKSKANGDRAKK